MLRVDIRDLQRGPVRTDGRLDPDDPDFYPLLERANSVDVTEVVREELALAAQTDLLLCRDDCAGLCPKCGADLNAGPCGCHTIPAEPV